VASGPRFVDDIVALPGMTEPGATTFYRRWGRGVRSAVARGRARVLARSGSAQRGGADSRGACPPGGVMNGEGWRCIGSPGRAEVFRAGRGAPSRGSSRVGGLTGCSVIRAYRMRYWNCLCHSGRFVPASASLATSKVEDEPGNRWPAGLWPDVAAGRPGRLCAAWAGLAMDDGPPSRRRNGRNLAVGAQAGRRRIPRRAQRTDGRGSSRVGDGARGRGER